MTTPFLTSKLFVGLPVAYLSDERSAYFVSMNEVSASFELRAVDRASGSTQWVTGLASWKIGSELAFDPQGDIICRSSQLITIDSGTGSSIQYNPYFPTRNIYWGDFAVSASGNIFVYRVSDNNSQVLFVPNSSGGKIGLEGTPYSWHELTNNSSAPTNSSLYRTEIYVDTNEDVIIQTGRSDLTSFSNTGQFKWKLSLYNSATSDNSKQIFKVIPSKSGELYVIGKTDVTGNVNNLTDVFVNKYDVNRSLVWQKSLNLTYVDTVNDAILSNSEGLLYLTGLAQKAISSGGALSPQNCDGYYIALNTSNGSGTAQYLENTLSVDSMGRAFQKSVNGLELAYGIIDRAQGESVFSTKILSISLPNTSPTGSVTITGTKTQGQTLTASNNIADADGLGAITYQWKAAGVNISGATTSTYTLTQAEVGKAISVVASYTDLQGASESLTSTSTSSVVNINDLPTGTVTITGTVTQGQTLTATNSIVDVDGLGAIAYTWKANGTTIGTGATYTLTQAEVGKTITATASYTDVYGATESVASSATSSVANVNDLPTGSVTISGTATQGQTLTATNNLADLDGLGAVTYTWKANGTTIGTGTTYTLTQSEVGKTITATASYTDLSGTAESVASGATSSVISWLQFGLQFTRISTNTKWSLSSYGNIENRGNTDTSYFVPVSYGDISDPLYGLFNELWNDNISSNNVTLDPTSKQVGVSMATWTYAGTMQVSGDIAPGTATAFSNSETLNDRLFDLQKIVAKSDGTGFYLVASTLLAPTYKLGLYVSEFASDGRETHSPVLISNSTPQTFTNSSRIIDVVQTNSGLIVLYSTNNGSNLNIAKLSISNGVITSASFSDVYSYVSRSSVVAHNAAVVETSSGQIAVGYTQYENNTSVLENLYLQTFDNQLNKLSNYQISSASLDSQGAAQTPYYGGVDLISTGSGYKLFWALQWNMKSATVSPSGIVTKSDFLLDTSVEKSYAFIFDPQVIKYSDNSYVIGWKVGGGFYVKSFDARGHAIGPATFVATPNGGDVYAIDLGTTNDQNLIVQYQTSIGINVAKFANHSNTTYYSKTLLATDSDSVVVDASVAKNATMFTLSSGDYLITNLDMVSAPTEPSGPLSIIGTLSADTLTGGRFNDTLSGMGGNDTLIGNAGNDDITGDSADISVYSGNLSNYTISASNGLITITDNRIGSSFDGTDTLRGINLLKFADGMEFVGLAAQRVALTGAEVNHTVQVSESKLYSGTNAAEKFMIGSNVSSMILAGEGDTVHLTGSFTDYTYAARGSELQITKGDFMTTVNLAGNVSIETDLGHVNAKLDFTQTTPRVMLDTQLVSVGSIDATLLNTHAVL